LKALGHANSTSLLVTALVFISWLMLFAFDLKVI